MGLHDYHFDPALLREQTRGLGQALELVLVQRLVLALLVLALVPVLKLLQVLEPALVQVHSQLYSQLY
jgi:hypothetical protein